MLGEIYRHPVTGTAEVSKKKKKMREIIRSENQRRTWKCEASIAGFGSLELEVLKALLEGVRRQGREMGSRPSSTTHTHKAETLAMIHPQ